MIEDRGGVMMMMMMVVPLPSPITHRVLSGVLGPGGEEYVL